MTCTNFLDLLRVNSECLSVVETGGGVYKKESVFQNFRTCLCILPPFHDIFSYVARQTKKSVFYVEIKFAFIRTTKRILTECIASVLSRHTGVITSRVKEKSAALYSK